MRHRRLTGPRRWLKSRSETSERKWRVSAEAYEELATNPKGHAKVVRLRCGRNRTTLLLHRFALVGKGDWLRFGDGGTSKVFVEPHEAGNPLVPVTPVFTTADRVAIGRESFAVRVRDLEPFDGLETRWSSWNSSTTRPTGASGNRRTATTVRRRRLLVGGRRAVMYAEIKLGARWEPAGYVDLQMPLMMCKPRHVLFQRPYAHPTRSISWDRWDQHSIKQNLNTIVRVARVVVTPELRGLGLTRCIVKAAKAFARERWHIRGVRPVFMEISAEMLNHVDFVSSSGFTYVGRTEGNVDRVVKDMAQMSRSRGGEFGIMSLQRKYHRALQEYCEADGISFEEGVEVLRRKVEEPANSLTTGEWAVLRKIVRMPIPYYLCGLDEYSDHYLREGLEACEAARAEYGLRPKRVEPSKAQVNISDLRLRAEYRLPETPSTKLVMAAFGLEGETVHFDIVQGVSGTVSGGNIVLVAGSSGSGKTALLKALDPTMRDANVSVGGMVTGNYTAAWPRPITEELPLFEVLAQRYSAERDVRRAESGRTVGRVSVREALLDVEPGATVSRDDCRVAAARRRCVAARRVLRGSGSDNGKGGGPQSPQADRRHGTRRLRRVGEPPALRGCVAPHTRPCAAGRGRGQMADLPSISGGTGGRWSTVDHTGRWRSGVAAGRERSVAAPDRSLRYPLPADRLFGRPRGYRGAGPGIGSAISVETGRHHRDVGPPGAFPRVLGVEIQPHCRRIPLAGSRMADAERPVDLGKPRRGGDFEHAVGRRSSSGAGKVFSAVVGDSRQRRGDFCKPADGRVRAGELSPKVDVASPKKAAHPERAPFGG